MSRGLAPCMCPTPQIPLAKSEKKARVAKMEDAAVYGIVCPMGRVRAWDDDRLRKAVGVNETIAGVLRSLGLVQTGGSYAMVRTHARRLGLDLAHFTGQAWARGKRKSVSQATPIGEVLVRGRRTNTTRLRERLIRLGLKERRCEECGLTEWRGRPAPLELDHANGDRSDNRLENLRILCPNCHAFTPSYRGRNVASARPSVDEIERGVRLAGSVGAYARTTGVPECTMRRWAREARMAKR